MLATAEGRDGAKGTIMASICLPFKSHLQQKYVTIMMSRRKIEGHSVRFFIRARWRDGEATG